ncbi:MAG TPA: ABC transporter ATP-binding protein [Anaerolineales bacterium]|nr:ABC transporter ATP-binding protein [Anaerolineales bacterium]
MLKLEGIHARYGLAKVLHNVSLEVKPGEIVALVGSNGAGKTTMVKVIMGLLKPSAGKMLLGEKDVTSVPAWERVELGIACVPEGRRLFPKMTVEENLIVGSFNKHAKPLRAVTLQEVYKLFPRLEERRTQKAKTLSGGEQQMLAVGRALMAKPKIVIFDEPSLGLSPKLVGEVLNIIKNLNKELGLPILLIEQDVAASLEISDRGYVLENGKMVVSDDAKALLKSDLVKQAYLGM